MCDKTLSQPVAAGLVGADIANVVNEAQLNAVRAGRKVISKRDMYNGIDRFTQGEKRSPLPTTSKLPTTVRQCNCWNP